MATILKLAPEGTSPRIDEVRKLILAKILKSCSVGFVPVEAIPRPGSRKGGQLYKKQILRECSVVAIPANANALALEAKALGVSNSLIKLIFKQSVNATLSERQERARAVLARAKAALGPGYQSSKSKTGYTKPTTLTPQQLRAKASRERAEAALGRGRKPIETESQRQLREANEFTAKLLVDDMLAREARARNPAPPDWDDTDRPVLTWNGKLFKKGLWR